MSVRSGAGLVRTVAAALLGAALFACGSANNNGYGGDGGGGLDATAGDGGPSFGEGGNPDAQQGALVVQPPNPVLTVAVPGPAGTQQFQALLNGTKVTASWSVDNAAIGTIDGAGLFTASSQVGGVANVTAQAGGTSGSTTVTVKLQILDNPGNVSTATQMQLENGGNADSTFGWLYPYDKTVFPRGLNPPELQLAGTAPSAVYVHMSAPNIDYKGFFAGNNPIQVTMSSAMWQTVTESVGATDTLTVGVTKIAGGAVAGPATETWSIAQGSLKGTVYYNSYNSKLAGNTGAIMSVRPGTPASVVVAGCRVCHTVSADGSTLVAANEPSGMGSSDRVWDLKNNLATLYDAPNREWAFGALYPDGSRFLRFGAVPDTNMPGASWAPNVRGLGQHGDLPSMLFNPKTGAQIPAPGLDGASLHMMMPIFSPDGKMVAFNHYDTGQGHTIAVMNFDPATNTFSGLRDIATLPSSYLGWPAFTPDDKTVFFAAGTNIEYDTVSDDTSQIPQPTSDLYVADVPSATIATADVVNGKMNGQYYLPFGEMAEGHLNYEPTVLPVAVGGYYWLVFTTRREYGNTLNDADPYNLNASPGSRKKLWVAAVDLEDPAHPRTQAQDVTHPAFYLDGQELASGNMRGFWVLDPCKQNGNSCNSGDQCCTGFCRQGSGGEGGTGLVCVPPPSGCAQEFEKCTTTADCCGASAGYLCINGYCARPSPH